MDTQSNNNVEKELPNKEEPQLGLSHGDNNGEVVLTLALKLNDVWNPELFFSLLPVGLEKVDILEAQLRDLQEECTQLKVKVDRQQAAYESGRMLPFLSVSSTADCQCSGIVVWNATTPREITASHFQLAYDHSQVKIRVAGIYQVQIRLSMSNQQHNSIAAIFLVQNNVDVAACSKGSSQLFEILRLQANDTLGVRFDSLYALHTDPLENRFTVTCLGN